MLEAKLLGDFSRAPSCGSHAGSFPDGQQRAVKCRFQAFSPGRTGIEVHASEGSWGRWAGDATGVRAAVGWLSVLFCFI